MLRLQAGIRFNRAYVIRTCGREPPAGKRAEISFGEHDALLALAISMLVVSLSAFAVFYVFIAGATFHPKAAQTLVSAQHCREMPSTSAVHASPAGVVGLTAALMVRPARAAMPGSAMSTLTSRVEDFSAALAWVASCDGIKLVFPLVLWVQICAHRARSSIG